jgi:hypothetical protein
LLSIRHFAESGAAILGSLSFLSVVSEWRAGCTLFWRQRLKGRRSTMCIINRTPEIYFRRTTTLTPEQFIAGLTDFGPGRSKLFANSTDEYLKLHYLGRSEADVTEGSGDIWERLHYDRSDSKRVVLTTTDSKVWSGLSGYTYTFTRHPDGTTEIDVVIVRDGKNFKGRALGFLLRTFGRVVLKTGFENSVKAVEFQNGKPLAYSCERVQACMC